MEDWVHRALQRWPGVPALYGWLGLDRRGRWTIQGEPITRPQIIDTINANYAADDRGCWYFQNGPQRGYVTLEAAPLILRRDHDQLKTHIGQAVAAPTAVWLTEDGSILLSTEHGPGLLGDTDLDWASTRLTGPRGTLDDTALAEALTRPDGAETALRFEWDRQALAVMRLDRSSAPATLGYVLEPQPAS